MKMKWEDDPESLAEVRSRETLHKRIKKNYEAMEGKTDERADNQRPD